LPASEPAVLHSFHNAALKLLALFDIFRKKPLATLAHRGVIFRPKNPLPYWSPGIDHFTVNSLRCASILRSLGLSSKRVSYVPNAVPDERLRIRPNPDLTRACLGIPANVPLFLCISADAKYKGVSVLMRAFAKAFPADSPQSPRLLIAGLIRDWRPLLAELGMENSIRCLGYTEDVGSLLRMADAFVLPSLQESMPNTLLEALRVGLPCIGTKVGGVPDVIGDARTDPAGLLVAPGNVESLALALRDLAEDPTLRARMADAALRRGDLFTQEKRLERMEGVYQRILQARGLL
ncbi:MAG: glycosyltransferase family 4 protein, partial [Desulfovibrio sp.]|nr:glycosyltransferase family 4 protein [Desulfovibrio sp.]